MISDLIEESVQGRTLMESGLLNTLELGPDEIRAAEEYIRSHPDKTSYHLLFALRRKQGDVYASLPPDLRARVLCSALAHVLYLNDWGYLDPSGSKDGEAASALLETRAAARECLQPLLDDSRPAPLFGSEEATLSRMYQYRRSDFAYRYLALLLGKNPHFGERPENRDLEIERLREEISR